MFDIPYNFYYNDFRGIVSQQKAKGRKNGFPFFGKDMKRIAIVAGDIAMPGEKGLDRLRFLADFLCDRGFDVEIVTADFQHWIKRFRTAEEMAEAKKRAKCKVTFLHEDGYKRNIEPKRIFSYRTLAKNTYRYLCTQTYDLIYALIPDNYLCLTAGRYAKERGIPFIIDVEDLWPEAMRMVLDVPVLSDALFSYFTVCAKKAYALADGIVGSSDEYRDEPLKYGVKIADSVTVYVGNDLAAFDAGAAENAAAVTKPEGEFWVSYAGTLGASYDIATLLRAGAILQNERGRKDIRIKILGDGPQRAEFEAAGAAAGADASFEGYLPYPVMCAWLKASDLTVNSLVRKAPQSIVSKIGDYLAAGIPMINTGMNPEFRKKTTADGFGVNVEPEDPAALADAIEKLYLDPARRAEMGATARRLAEKRRYI